MMLSNKNSLQWLNQLIAVLTLLVLILTAINSAAIDKSTRITDFSGQWHLDLCDKSVSDQCGGFTVYLVQSGNTICGDHFFATPGLGRINEGAPHSVTGLVRGNTADIIITSGRNGAELKVRAVVRDNLLNWEIVEEVKPGLEGGSPLVLDKGKLRREKMGNNYQAVVEECNLK